MRTHKGLDYACVYVFYKAWTMHVCMCFTKSGLCMYMCCTERSDYACTCVVQRGLDYVCMCVSLCEVGVDFACPRARSGLCMRVRERGLYYACVCTRVREVVWTVCTCERD